MDAKKAAALLLAGCAAGALLWPQSAPRTIDRQRRPRRDIVLPAAQGKAGPVPTVSPELTSTLPGPLAVRALDIIAGVPPFLWRHGSGPTAVAMVLAYYDLNGFPSLMPGEPATQTELVNWTIASPEHYADYSLPLDAPPVLASDKSEAPAGDEHANNSIADHLWTSQSVYDNYYGWTWNLDVKVGTEIYVQSRTPYQAVVTPNHYTNIQWPSIRNEILSRRPMVFLVDPDGDGEPDLFVTVVGALTLDGVPHYGCYTTWEPVLRWFPYRENAPGLTWGVHTAYTFFVSHGVFPPLNARCERLVNDYFFYQESINRLTWQANADNRSRIVRTKIFRKRLLEPDTAYALIAQLDAEVFRYDDRGLRPGELHVYRLTFVDERGHESPATVAADSGTRP